jgi:cob(I)alamin adenosyltransferase
MSRVSKSSPRIEAYGTVDEANALIGTVRPTGHDDLDELLGTVQNHLHVVQADLANPDPDPDDPQVETELVETLEDRIDAYDEELEPLTAFVLPGGGESGARLHHARTVTRRAERRVVELASSEPINETVVSYLNRLSDLLFTLGRVANARDGEPEESPSY